MNPEFDDSGYYTKSSESDWISRWEEHLARALDDFLRNYVEPEQNEE